MLAAALLLLTAWTPKAPMPHPIWFLFQDPVLIDNQLHVAMGGQIWQYRPAEDKWETRSAPLQVKRVHYTTAAFGSRFYAFGGSAGEKGPQAAVEEFDFTEGKWRARTDLPGPRRDAAAVVLRDRIYIVGGFDKTNQPLPILVYDPARDTWESRRTRSKALCVWGAHEIGGRIYILGSKEETPESSVLEVYDPATDSMTYKRPIPWPRIAYATAVVNGRIYALGGQGTTLQDLISNVDVYDARTDAWTKVADLPKAKAMAGAIGVGTTIYVMGGVQHEWTRPEDAVDVLDVAEVAQGTK